MSVLKETAAAFSRSCRDIFYFISDDYDLIPRLIDHSPAVFAQRMQGRISQEYFVGSNTFSKLSTTYIEDCHYLFNPSLFSGEGVSAKQNKKVKKTARIFVCQDFHLFREAEQGVLLKQFLDHLDEKKCLLLLSAPILSVPSGYEQMVEAIDVPGPDEEDIWEQLMCYALLQAQSSGEKLDEAAKKRIQKAANDFKGLDFHEIEAVLHEMTGRYGSFYGRDEAQKYVSVGDDFKAIVKARRGMTDLARKEKARKDSTVTILETGEHVAGLGKYKEWFWQRESTVKDPNRAREDGKEPVRGVLMTGLPGTGKTQGAKYTAYRLGVPLVQLRIDNLLGGLVGDSEKNFKRYRKRVEMLAPCVVLIDEMEKLFADERGGGGGGSEVKMNIFTALLDWMQENKKGIFFYATCNSVKNLPSELLRDGRFSMRFSVFMPTYPELTEIICFHMKRLNDLSGGRVFESADGIVNRHGEISDEAAKRFLDEVTQYGRDNRRNMFFTGANIEALINEVQYNVQGKIGSIDQYVKAMLESAEGEFCQPYGEINLKSAVNFWIDALENNFTDAAGYGGNKSGKQNEGQRRLAPLSFHRFDRQKGVFANEELSFDNEYDKYLYEVFSEKIRQEYEKRSRDECYMLGQIAEKLEKMKR